MTWLERAQISPTVVPSHGTSSSPGPSTRTSTPRIGNPVVARCSGVDGRPGLGRLRVRVGLDSVMP